MININVLLYIILLLLYLPGFYLIIKKKLIIEMFIPSVYFISIFTFNVIGAFYVLWPNNSYRYVMNMGELFSVSYFLLLVVQALFFYMYILFFGNYSISKKKTRNITSNISDVKVYKILWLLTISILLFYFLRYGLPPLFNFSSVLDGHETILLNRRESIESVTNFHWFRLGFYTFPQLATVVAFLIFKQEKTIKNRKRFFVSLISSVVLALSFLHKSPIVVFIAVLFLANLLFDRKVIFSKVITFGILVSASIFLLYYVYFPDQNIEYYLNVTMGSILHRIIGVYTISLASAPILIDYTGFLYGTSFINPMSLFNFDNINLSNVIHKLLMGREGNWPTPALGEAYFNFGWMGVVLFLAIVNYILFSLQLFINKMFEENKIMWVSLSVITSIEVYKLATTSIFAGIMSPVFIICFLFIIIISKIDLFSSYVKK